MKKFFTLIALAVMTLGVSAQETVVYGMVDAGNNTSEFDLADGVHLKLNKDGKAFGKGKTINIDGTAYVTIKGSNGAQNELTLLKPASKITFYSYVNKATADAADRDNFWKEVNGKAYTKDDFTSLMKDFTDVEGYQDTPDEYSFDLDNATSITFNNTGYQPCFVIALTYGGGTTGITNVNATKNIDLNAPAYNLSGQRVGKDYKGIVIKNGQKFFNK